MEFEKRKAATLSSLGSSETDKSPKGTLDTPIIPLLNTLNAHPSYFTTSSCSGRISILSQPSTNTFPRPNNNNNNNKNKKKARGGSWLLITHDPANPDSVVSLLFPSAVGEPSALAAGNELVFRFEPLILAVDCKDIESAQSLVSLAISSGFRESGITSAGKKRVIVGIRCSIRMEVPLGDGGGDILVSPDYVRFLVGVANQKMEANRKRTEGFLSALRENGFVGPTVVENNVDGGFDDGGDDDDGDAGDDILERTDGHGHRVDHNGLLVPGCSLSISQMIIVGEPVEKLFRWGHSSCTLNLANRNEILVFGGFGGIGRHARRNDSLLLDPLTGALKAIDLEGAPMPRLGHTASLVGGFMFIIGGRADPLNILGDVWVLDTTSFEWRLLECTGSLFPPRHRHAATVDGSNIYVFGGLNNNTIFSSLHVLSTECMHWKEVLVGGEQPCARHSHAMVVYRSKLFVFGGYNGEKALGDLYSFDIQTLNWKQEKPLGRSPHARFSHSMFVYNNFIGVIGGCPVRKHSQGLALLDMQLNMWKHVMLDFIGRELFVRSTANIVGDDLIMLGGGAACYAFGTKFSEPLKTNLLPFMPLEGKIKGFEVGAESVTVQCDGTEGEKDICNQDLHVGNAETSIQGFDLTFESGKHQLDASHWVIQIERIYAKLGKDILKRLGWLDLGRKAYGEKDGLHICFPITEKLSSALIKKQHQYGDAFVGHDDALTSNSLVEGNLPNEFSCLTAFSLLKECGATVLPDEATQLRKTVKSPLQIMNESVGSLIGRKGLSEKLLDQIPTRWERLGDIVVLPVTSFKDPAWDLLGEELWPTIARSLNAHRLARQGRVASTGTRDSNLEILVGDNGWVEHRENGILYSFDATKCMFSWGNLSEKLRMARLHCEDEVVVDLFAGIGYFVLPFLVRAKAKLVYACEWNPYAVEALKQNLRANSVSDRCIVLEGDNRLTAPKGVASRVCLGLLPTSEGSWVTAVRALRKEGGVLHVHGNVEDTKESVWSEHVIRSFDQIARSEGHCWEVSLEHVERVKWYAPHVRHLVADVRCRHIQR